MTRLRADFMLLLAALIWGTAFIAQKDVVGAIGPVFFVGGRFLLSAALLAPLAFRESRRRVVAHRPRDLALAALIGVCLFTASTLQQVGLATTTVTNAGFITSLYIAMVPFMAWLLVRTKLRLSVLAACAVSLLGAWLLTNHGQPSGLAVGDLLVLIAAALYALHIVLVSSFLARSRRPFFLCFIQYGITAFGGILAGLLLEPVGWHGLSTALLPMLYAGLLSGGVGYTLQIVAQRYTPAAEAALIMSMESVFAAIAAALILGDRLDVWGLVGCGLILAGVVMVEIMPALPMLTKFRTERTVI